MRRDMGVSTAEFIAMQARLEKNKPTPPPPADAELIEGDLHDKIIAECGRRMWIAFHGSRAHRSKRTIGEPDFIIIANEGRVIMLEAKKKGAKLRPGQLALKIWAEQLGFSIHTVYSMEDVLSIFEVPPAGQKTASIPTLAK